MADDGTSAKGGDILLGIYIHTAEEGWVGNPSIRSKVMPGGSAGGLQRRMNNSGRMLTLWRGGHFSQFHNVRWIEEFLLAES